MIQTTHTIRRVATADATNVDDLLNSAVAGIIPRATIATLATAGFIGSGWYPAGPQMMAVRRPD